MVREIINVAILQHKPLEITYSKDGTTSIVFNLNTIAYSPKFGNNYICGYSEKHKSELTFSIDKIIYAAIDWIEIFGKDTSAKKNGLYLFTCRGDMHLEFELRKYKEGVKLQDYYQNEDGTPSCNSSVDVLAYHYMPFYTKEKQREWIPFERTNEERQPGYYTFAYIIDDNVSQEGNEYDWVDDYNNWINSRVFPSPWELTNTKENGIYYTVDCLSLPFDKLRIPNNIKVLAYNYCSVYREKEHGKHWRLADELGF